MGGWFKGGKLPSLESLNPLAPLTKEVRTLYIARPEGRLNRLIYKHPDKTIPRGAKLTVRGSECALFFREGRLIGRIEPGTVQLDTANFPFLGHLFVDGLTGGNHFLTELFFVSMKETIFALPKVTLGQYRDLNSGRVVSIEGYTSYTVKVTDAEALVLGLAGLTDDSESNVEAVINGRFRTQFSQAVGRQAQARPIMDIVSNVDAETFSTLIRESGRQEFAALGLSIGRLFDLAVALDARSLEDLREFGMLESKLAIDAKGAEIATHDGFAEFNYVKGQRAAMEGLGQGLGTGNSPMIFSGGSLGAAFQPPPGRSRPSPAARSPAPGGQILSSPAAFIIVADGIERGPYTARQVALMAISGGTPLDQLVIRRSDDPVDVTFTADLEPQIAAEVQRRRPTSGPAR